MPPRSKKAAPKPRPKRPVRREVAAEEPLVILKGPMTPRVDAEGKALSISPARPMQNPCKICPAKCCFPLVHVSLPEALRITSALDLPFLEAIALVPDDDPARSIALREDKRITIYLSPFQGRAALSLRRQAEGGCLFLGTFNGFRRCSIYTLRPSPCRIYPLHFQKGDRIGGPPVILCPVPYGVGPGAEAMLEEVVGQAVRDWALHTEIVAAFAASGLEPTVDAFLRFALPRTAEAIGVSAESSLGTLGAEAAYVEAIRSSKR